MCVFALTVFLITNPTWIFDKYEQVKEDRHRVQMENVMKNNIIIQTEMERLLYKTNADRVLLLQYHNTKNSLAGVPFIYLTATHECVNENVQPVASGYEVLKTSLYPFVNYMAKIKYFCGDIDDLRQYDKALAFRMEGNDVKHLAVCHIDCQIPLGVIVVTYTNDVNINHSCENVENYIRNTAMEIGILINQ